MNTRRLIIWGASCEAGFGLILNSGYNLGMSNKYGIILTSVCLTDCRTYTNTNYDNKTMEMVVNVTNYGCWVSNEDHYNPTFEHWGFCTKFINELHHQPLIIKTNKTRLRWNILLHKTPGHSITDQIQIHICFDLFVPINYYHLLLVVFNEFIGCCWECKGWWWKMKREQKLRLIFDVKRAKPELDNFCLCAPHVIKVLGRFILAIKSKQLNWAIWVVLQFCPFSSN